MSGARGAVVVTVCGVLDDPGAARLERVLGDLIDGRGNPEIVVDLAELQAARPSGVSMFARAGTRASQHGGVLVLRDPPRMLSRSLELRRRVKLTATSGGVGRRDTGPTPDDASRARGKAEHPAGGHGTGPHRQRA